MGTIRNAPSENAPSDPDTAPWSLWRRSSSSRRSRWSCSTSPSSTSPCPHSSAIWGSPPDLHLLLVPVSPSSSQRYQRRDMSGSPSNCRARPLTVGWIMRLSGNRPGSPLRRSGTRPSNRRSRGCRCTRSYRPPSRARTASGTPPGPERRRGGAPQHREKGKGSHHRRALHRAPPNAPPSHGVTRRASGLDLALLVVARRESSEPEGGKEHGGGQHGCGEHEPCGYLK